jgi:hypothetical protein
MTLTLDNFLKFFEHYLLFKDSIIIFRPKLVL